MPNVVLALADLAAILVLTLGIYYPRHRRHDLVTAYLAVNVGVLAVTIALATSSAAGIGVGLGLFGVLSIIRLRSAELSQHEIAYYFAALTLGLLGGLGVENLAASVGLMIALLLVLGVADHPRLLRGSKHQEVILDRAIPDHTELVSHLTELLNGKVSSVSVRRLDLVNDTTIVDVVFAPRGALDVAEVSADERTLVETR